MSEEQRARQKKRTRLWLALILVLALVAVVVVPPLVGTASYKARVTQLMSTSLGRPVRLSSVELRLFPQPGFVITDLAVADDPLYGAEPILHANTVKASIRLLSLWRGRLEIGSISVDEASLNLVRSPEGKWNLDSLFRTATAKTGAPDASAGKHAAALPSLEATNSRINIKRGVEKLPYALLNTDLRFWQASPGEWRIRLRGQPARTDLSQVDMADAGLVRIDASVRQSPGLRQMPMHIDVEWREAQLGQLARLAVGSDPGWRGDLTGQLQMDGTLDEAAITTRLQATGVHRAEFAPAAPLDFDARCSFRYHFTGRAIQKLACDSPLGNGHIRIAGDLSRSGPNLDTGSHFSIELEKIPVAAGLDALRTLRSGFGAGLEAKGEISGKIAYGESAPMDTADAAPAKPKPHAVASKAHASKPKPAAPQGPLTGSFTVDGFELRGEKLSAPITAAKLVIQPVNEAPEEGQPETAASSALVAMVVIPAGAPTPLTVNARLALTGYQLGIHGQASVARGRELAHLAGLPEAAALDALAGEPIAFDVTAQGPWLLPEIGSTASAQPASQTDQFTGTLTMHNANWKADFLAIPVLISQATLHLEAGAQRWDPVAFSYGPVKGTASVTVAAPCKPPQICPASQPIHFDAHFSQLDTNAAQAALLGAHEKGTLLSSLLARFSAASPATVWPALEGTVKADALTLGPITLHDASATVGILDRGAEIKDIDASLLGGHLQGAATFHAAGSGQEKPSYTFEGTAEKLNPAAVGPLLGQRWSGGKLDAKGMVELAGFTTQDLAFSAKGALHFDWQYGAISGLPSAIPSSLARFDDWKGDAKIVGGAFAIQQSTAKRGGKKQPVDADGTLGSTAHLSFEAPKPAPAKPDPAKPDPAKP